MVSLRLVRLETCSRETLGVLKVNGQIECVVLEPPKMGNKRELSCIPTGRYLCKRYYSEKYKTDCMRIYDVPNRDYISIHYGNTCKDTKGCLIVGTYTGFYQNNRAVLRSKRALKGLLSHIKDIAYLTIEERF